MTPLLFDLRGKSVWVAGHRGMVGSAIVRRLASEPISDLITATSDDVDLRDQGETFEFVRSRQPDIAILAAARVGGINANRNAQAEFLYDNLMINANSLEACRLAGVQKIVMLGSSCIYPRDSPQPIRESYLLSGPLEATNEGYAIAKIAALELGKMYRRDHGVDAISLMPTNLYGPGDNYNLATSHVFPALIRKIHEAKVAGSDAVTLWGSGTPRREFLHADDVADATVFCLGRYSGEEHVNVGTGRDISILELAELMAEIIGWNGRFVLDASMPDGTLVKRLDVTKLGGLGWEARIGLQVGIEQTYADYVDSIS